MRGRNAILRVDEQSEKRLAAHNAGTASKYTAARRPVEMVYLEEKETKQEAMKREAAIKKLKRKEKMKLAALS